MNERLANGRFISTRPALQRFISYCRFEPETGCVVWTGGKTSGRGHHAPYGAFKYEGRRWFAHRWSARFIHGLEIDDLQVDHCCPHIPHPNTLCVEHVQALTLLENRELQALRAFEARKRAIHIQVGLIEYEQVYGPIVEPDPDAVPFFNPPAWLGIPNERTVDGRNDAGIDDARQCPF